MADQGKKPRVVAKCEVCGQYAPARLGNDGSPIPIGTGEICSCDSGEYTVLSQSDRVEAVRDGGDADPDNADTD